MQEYGYPFAVTSDYGHGHAQGCPEPIRAKLEMAIRETLEEKVIQETVANIGIDRRFITGKEFEAMVKKTLADIPRLSEYVEDVE